MVPNDKGTESRPIEGEEPAATMSATTTQDFPALIIEPREGLARLRLRELWEYRELFYFLVWRDIKVRYKQTALGAAWAILQPLATAAVFTVFFGRIVGIASDGVPYSVFAYSGLLVWTFFAHGVTGGAVSLVGSANLITKVYFPRLVVPGAAVLSGFVDLAVAFPLLLVIMALHGMWPGLAVLSLPLILLLAFITTAGVGLWLSALCVEYRDIRHVVPFLVQLWLFVTPVIYPSSKVAPTLTRWGLPHWFLGLNPMTGVVEGFRAAMLGTTTTVGPLLGASFASGSLILLSALLYFRSVERSFADVV